MPGEPLIAQFAEGLLLGLGLFAAPGPKDTLLIRQAISGAPTAEVVALCVVADVVLIAIGVGGMGALLGRRPDVVSLLTLAGAAYLLWFASQRWHACVHNTSMPDTASSPASRRQVLREAVALGFANPYAWLDTVILIGSMGAAKHEGERTFFVAGTMAASLVWFVLLAAGSRRLQTLFRSPRAWRVLDAAVAVLMVGFAVHLVVSVMRPYG